MIRPRTIGKSRLTAGAAGAAMMALALGLVGGFEGVTTKAVIPIPGDVPTICFGETLGVKMGDTATMAECRAQFGARIQQFAAGIEKCLVSPQTIPAKVYVASLSLAYNIGETAFCRSTIVRRLNAGQFRDACEGFKVWNRADGRVVRGLTNRREAERKLCLEGL